MRKAKKKLLVVFVFYFVYFFLQTLCFVLDIRCIRSVKNKVDRTDVNEEWMTGMRDV